MEPSYFTFYCEVLSLCAILRFLARHFLWHAVLCIKTAIPLPSLPNLTTYMWLPVLSEYLCTCFCYLSEIQVSSVWGHVFTVRSFWPSSCGYFRVWVGFKDRGQCHCYSTHFTANTVYGLHLLYVFCIHQVWAVSYFVHLCRLQLVCYMWYLTLSAHRWWCHGRSWLGSQWCRDDQQFPCKTKASNREEMKWCCK